MRHLLDSCQKDMTITSDTHNSYETLQKAIDGYKERLEKIEADPSIAPPSGICSSRPCTLLSAKYRLRMTSFSGMNAKSSAIVIERDDLLRKETILKEENKKLKEKVQHLSDQLEYRHLKGDFDPRQTKIIHLK